MVIWSTSFVNAASRTAKSHEVHCQIVGSDTPESVSLIMKAEMSGEIRKAVGPGKIYVSLGYDTEIKRLLVKPGKESGDGKYSVSIAHVNKETGAESFRVRFIPEMFGLKRKDILGYYGRPTKRNKPDECWAIDLKTKIKPYIPRGSKSMIPLEEIKSSKCTDLAVEPAGKTAKKPAGKSTAKKTPAAKKAPAKKAPEKKESAKKAPAKKAPVKAAAKAGDQPKK